MEQKAKEFATWAHAEQKRKFTGEPYIVHPAAVAAIVKKVPHTEEMVCAAWLHDVVEDCGILNEEIYAKFGAGVAKLVFFLSDKSKPEDGNRTTRKLIDLHHIKIAPSAAKTVKLADLMDNTRTIVEHDQNFARVYLREKLHLLEVLRDGDQELWHQAYNIAVDGCQKLNIRL